MSNPSSQIAFVYPEHLATLVEIGLETREETDRLLALEAANHFDTTHPTAYGKEVIEIFMDQLGLKFEDDTRPYREDGKPDGESYKTVKSRLGRLMIHVYQAIGSDIGLKMKAYQYVAEGPDGVPLVTDAFDSVIAPVPQKAVPLYTPPLTNLGVVLKVSDQVPLSIEQKLWGDKCEQNFAVAMDAVSCPLIGHYLDVDSLLAG